MEGCFATWFQLEGKGKAATFPSRQTRPSLPHLAAVFAFSLSVLPRSTESVGQESARNGG